MEPPNHDPSTYSDASKEEKRQVVDDRREKKDHDMNEEKDDGTGEKKGDDADTKKNVTEKNIIEEEDQIMVVEETNNNESEHERKKEKFPINAVGKLYTDSKTGDRMFICRYRIGKDKFCNARPIKVNGTNLPTHYHRSHDVKAVGYNKEVPHSYCPDCRGWWVDEEAFWNHRQVAHNDQRITYDFTRSRDEFYESMPWRENMPANETTETLPEGVIDEDLSGEAYRKDGDGDIIDRNPDHDPPRSAGDGPDGASDDGTGML